MKSGMCDLEKNYDVDRISVLPEKTLQLIMSFLPFEQRVQISVVSKVWLQAWHRFPVLEIDEIKFRGPKCSERILQSRRYWEKVLEIRQRDKVSIRKLTVRTDGSDAALDFAHSCICYAIENNVQELEIKHKQLRDMWYILPPMVLSSKSMNVLKLHGHKLESLENDDVELSSLRELHLSDVHADDQVMKNLFAQCPLLHHLEIAHDDNLLSISSCFENLKHLHLRDVSCTDEWLNSQVSSLQLLEHLYISGCDNAESIKISSPRLRELIIYCCEELVEVKFDTPNLRIFKYIGYAVSLSLGALALSETHLWLYSRHNIYDSQWCVKYIDLLARFHKFSKVLNLQACKYETLHVPGELRLILPHPLSGAKHLNFTASLAALSFGVAKFIDFLLWISPHAESVFLDCPYNKKFYFKFTYKHQPVYEEETAQCCKTLPITCWEHCMNKVEIEVREFQTRKVESFIFERENILAKINGLVESGYSNLERAS